MFFCLLSLFAFILYICFYFKTLTFKDISLFFSISLPTVMQSTELISSQPSQDSLSSYNNFLFSDDETDVFLLENRFKPHGFHLTQSGLSDRNVHSMNREQEHPGSQWACDGFIMSSDLERSQDNSHARSTSSSISSYLSLSSSSSSVLEWSSSESEQGKNGRAEGDLLFARKVRLFLPVLNPLHMVLTSVSSSPIKCSQWRSITFYL